MTYHNSDFQPCARRDRLVKVNTDGSREPLFRCTEQQAEHYFKEVTPDMCEGCPLRQGLTKAAIARREYKPPLVEEHREIRSRKADKDDPLWAPCVDRQVVETPACCGTLIQIKVCNSVDCFRMGSEVSREICRDCLNRCP